MRFCLKNRNAFFVFMDLSYYDYAFRKLKTHKKIALIWFRQSGKSKFLEDAVVDYCLNNKNKNVIVFSPYRADSQRRQELISCKLNQPMKEYGKIENNSTVILFKQFNRMDDDIRNMSCDFIVVDEFTNMSSRSFNILYGMLLNTERVLFAMDDINNSNFSVVDNNCDFYLNIVDMKSVMTKDEMDEINKKQPLLVINWGINLWDVYDFLSSDMYKLKKDKNLIDYYSLKKSRELKLEKIEKSRIK